MQSTSRTEGLKTQILTPTLQFRNVRKRGRGQYHENFSLSLRLLLAEYENEKINEKLTSLTSEINIYVNDNNGGIRKYLEKINVSIMPKSFKVESSQQINSAFYFSNANKLDEYILEKETLFIECPIEIHIISVLWIMKIGQKLDAKLEKHCYGNRLHRNGDDQYEESSIKLFKRYYLSYNNWRDDAIKKAKGLHKLNLDVAILSLDLKSYYNSIDFNFDTIKNIHEKFEWLNIYLKEVHFEYAKLLEKWDLIKDKGKSIMPIGLISSNILANYYLRDFDSVVVNKIKPEFYGRYVDDIMFVISNPKINPRALNPVNNFLDRYLANRTIWSKSSSVLVGRHEDGGDYYIQIKSNKLDFQIKKVKLYHLLAEESANLLDEFEKEIKKNSSEFKFQPESKNIFQSFENSSYKISYSDTINKLRSIDGFNVDKLGASKHLAKLISSTVNAEKLSKEDLEDIDEKILGFFSGQRGLELNALWEKVFTFYVVNQAKEQLIRFAKHQITSILKIKDLKRKEGLPDCYGIHESLLKHLTNCFSMAASLNILFFNEAIIAGLNKGIRTANPTSNHFEFITLELVTSKARALKISNLFRHNYLYYPLLNYCSQVRNFNYLNKQVDKKTKFILNKRKIDYSPRFIHYHELCLFLNLQEWFSPDTVDEKYKENKLNRVFELYQRINKLSDNDSFRNCYPFEESFARGKGGENEVKRIEIKSGRSRDKLRVGLVNTIIDLENSKASLLGIPNLSFERLDEINQVLNESLSAQKCDVIIFPEISIPFQWLPILSSFSKRNNIVISCGVEHFVNDGGFVFNYVATILPFTVNKYQNALIDIRLKKDYSPEEVEEIVGRKLSLPLEEMRAEQLRLYVWNDIHFSVFNCFELADIRKRAIFRGLVDFVAAVEHNQDINYFSNIIESVARDVHSYVIQVNSSHYGDNRITQPAETFQKDIVRIKGGNDISLITGTINITALRDHQKVDYQLQKRSKIFKPTPPNFDISLDRKKNKRNKR